jgi:dolichol-phosphate mannosyltransferase
VDEHRYLIVLPTYDERENLPRVIEALAEVRDRTPFGGDVLVVDDNSPDGTGDLADQLAQQHEWLHVLHR